jgi:hypothetical protein
MSQQHSTYASARASAELSVPSIKAAVSIACSTTGIWLLCKIDNFRGLDVFSGQVLFDFV